MRKSNLIKKADNRIYFKIFVAVLWSESILMGYIRGAMLNLPILSFLAGYFIPCTMGLLFLMSYKTFAERLRGVDFVFVMTCLVVYVFEFWLYKRNRDYFRAFHMDFVLGALPFYFVGVALRDDDKEIFNWLYKISVVTIVAFAVNMMFINQMESQIMQAGDMSSAYNLLPHVCLTFYYLMKKFGWGRLLIFLLATLSLLMMGNRGSVLCLVLFMVVVTVLTVRFRNPLILFGLVAILFLIVYFKGILDYLIEFVYYIGETFGLSTRVFDKILSGNITFSSGRSEIRQRVQYYLREYPIVGLGVYGDCFVAEGKYAHNLFLEIYAHFGYLMGTVLVVSLIVYICRSVAYVFKIKDENAQLASLLLLGCCFKLVVSSSYLREPFFWLMLGYFASLLRECRLMGVATEKPKTESRLIK